MSRRPPPLEVEAKFDVLDRRATRALLRGDALAGLDGREAVRRIRLEDRYVEAPDGRLAEAGWAARIRTANGASPRLQLKRLQSADRDGVRSRTELDGPAGEGLAYEAWPISAARRRLIQVLDGRPLEDLVTLRQDREVRTFGGPDGEVEVSLDRTDLLADGEPAGRITVLEVEQLNGGVGAFAAARTHLGALEFLAPSAASKLGWARSVAARLAGSRDWHALADDQPEAFRSSTAEVGRRIIRAQLGRLQDREADMRAATDPESVRRLRVATRRLRATFRAFGPTYADREIGRVRRELSRLADRLSQVRDLDVVRSRIREVTEADPALEAGLAPFAAAVDADRATALETLRGHLASSRHGRLVDDLQAFAETPGRWVAPVAPPAPRAAADQLGGWIWARWEELLGWEPLLADPRVDPLVLHDLRLRAKRFRDLVQVLAPVAGLDPAPIVAPVVRLQDRLGDLNDSLVAVTMARRRVETEADPLDQREPEALAAFIAAQEHRIADARRAVPGAWSAATSATARRRVGRLAGAF